MTRKQTMLVLRDTAAAVLGLAVSVTVLLWAAWEIDFGISRTTFLRITWTIVLVGFAVFLTLYVLLVWLERTAHYTHRRISDLHPPLIASTAALASYFGIQSISAVDFFYHPRQSWPLVMDPTVRLLWTTLVLALVLAKVWTVWEILPSDRWTFRWRKPPRYPARRS